MPDSPLPGPLSPAIRRWRRSAIARFQRLRTVPDRLLRLWRRGGWRALRDKAIQRWPGRSPETAHRGAVPFWLRARFRRRWRRWATQPVVSVAMVGPPEGADPVAVGRSLASLANQVYPRWELLAIAPPATLDRLASRRAARDPRVRAIAWEVADPDRADPLAALDRAWSEASGAAIVVLEPGDRLMPQALYRFAAALRDGSPAALYGDEAIVDERDRAVAFAFRPAWSPEYLRGFPYISHPVCWPRATLHRAGGFSGLAGAGRGELGTGRFENAPIWQETAWQETAWQELSWQKLSWRERMQWATDRLLLQLAERTLAAPQPGASPVPAIADRVVHLPELLYLNADPVVPRLGDGALAENGPAYLQGRSRGVAALAGNGDPRLPANPSEPSQPATAPPRVLAIVPTKNRGDLVRQCLDSFDRAIAPDEADLAIALVDHASDDRESLDYFAALQRRPACRVFRYGGPFNFSAINNWAIARWEAAGEPPPEFYLFCNNDVEAIAPGWLGRMAALGRRSNVGVVGAKLLYGDRQTVQHAGVGVGLYGAADHYGKFAAHRTAAGAIAAGPWGLLATDREVSAVTAACLLMRREAFAAIGGYDEGLRVGFGDVDLCLRARAAGYAVVQCNRAVLVHHESLSRGQTRDDAPDPHPEDTARFQARWDRLLRLSGGYFQCADPFFNPHLAAYDRARESAAQRAPYRWVPGNFPLVRSDLQAR